MIKLIENDPMMISKRIAIDAHKKYYFASPENSR